MRKTGAFLYTIFALLFAALPPFIISMSRLAVERYEGFSSVMKPAAGLALAVLVICAVPVEFKKLPDWAAAGFWACAASWFRIRCYKSLSGYMVMKYDFAGVLESARGAVLPKEAIFTHWAFYPRLLALWDGLLGDYAYSYSSAVKFNILVTSLTVAMVYVCARLVWKRQRVAMAAAAIICFWPSFAYYSAVTSNEHLAMFFMLLAGICAIIAYKLYFFKGAPLFAGEGILKNPFSGKEETRKKFKPDDFPKAAKTFSGCARPLVFALFSGVFAGCADMFKQFSPLFLLACFGAALVFRLLGLPRQKCPEAAAEGTARAEIRRTKSGGNAERGHGGGVCASGETVSVYASCEADAVRAYSEADASGAPGETVSAYASCEADAPGMHGVCRKERSFLRCRSAKTCGKRRSGLKSAAAVMLALSLIFLSSSMVKTLSLRWLDRRFGRPVARSATAHFLWIGLNSKGGGMWSEEEGLKVYELAKKYNNDYTKVMGELWDLLKEDYRLNKDKLPLTIDNKMREDWGADVALSLWMRALYDEGAAWEGVHGVPITWDIKRAERDLYDFDPGDAISKTSAAMYIAVMGMVAAGALAAIFIRQAPAMYLRLVFYGYALLFILSEAQGRYQVVLFPIFAMLAAGAGEELGKLAEKIYTSIKKSPGASNPVKA